jgi:hypothetical protein
MELEMPRKLNLTNRTPDWFDRLPGVGLVREYCILAHPDNPAPLIQVGAETFRRWGLQGLAPKPIVIGGTRHYRVDEIRRWLRGDWNAGAGGAQ